MFKEKEKKGRERENEKDIKDNRKYGIKEKLENEGKRNC